MLLLLKTTQLWLNIYENYFLAVQAATQVPFAPWVVRQSRAGPIACD